MTDLNVTAPAILQAGINHMQDRAATYDKPEGERSMGMTVALANILLAEKLKAPLSEEDGWNFMELLKLVRSKQGDFKADNYEDRSAYAGLAGEAAWAERGIHSSLCRQDEASKAPNSANAQRALEFGYTPWLGKDRPTSGLVECLQRDGLTRTERAGRIDWHVDERSPLLSDVIGFRVIEEGHVGEVIVKNALTFPVIAMPEKPDWEDAPANATHLLRVTENGGYAWGVEQAHGRFKDATDENKTLWPDCWEVFEARPVSHA